MIQYHNKTKTSHQSESTDLASQVAASDCSEHDYLVLHSIHSTLAN